jgi:ABC-type lipoprotein export system ATPase subunit
VTRIQHSVQRNDKVETTAIRLRKAQGKFSDPTPMRKKSAATIESPGWSSKEREMITLRNVTSPTGVPNESGLDTVSLTIEEGEVVSVAGLSAFARRRLLAVLGLYAEDWAGEYELFGHLVHRLDSQQRADLRGELVGALMRSTPLVECLTVEENLEIPLSYRGVAAGERSGLIDEALSRFGILPIRESEIESLPADQRQLAGIAKALVSNPRLVLLEAPDQHLSALQIRMVAHEIERLRQNGCVVVQVLENAGSNSGFDRVIDLDEVAVGRQALRRSRTPRSRLSSSVGLC